MAVKNLMGRLKLTSVTNTKTIGDGLLTWKTRWQAVPYSHTMSDLFPYDQSPTPTVPDLSDQIECTTEVIGRGGYGSVYKGRWLGAAANTRPTIIAIKVIDLVPLKDEVKRKRRFKLITRELSIWCSIQHENVLPLLEIALINDDTNIPAFVCPWMENGNAKEFCSRNPCFPPILILYDIINGLHYLHTFKPEIVHGDIKAVNVLINNRCKACLCDFGLSRFLIDNTLWKTTATVAGGTARWMAPELISGDASMPTKESDIYAYAMTCYEILSGNVPFKSVSNEMALLFKVIKGERPGCMESFHSDFMWDIITRCWKQEPKDRPPTEIVLGLLRAKHDDTTAYLKRRLEEDNLQLEAKKREREKQHLFLTPKVITDETFAIHEGFDLASFDENNWPSSDLPTFRVLKQESYQVFKSRVAQHFGYPEDQIHLWVLVDRRNKTVRPDAHIPENEPTLTVEVIRNNMAARQHDLRLYLEVIPDPTKLFPPPQSIMIFLKHFVTSKQNLYGIGKTYVLITSKVGDLILIINERMRWAPGTPLRLFEEIKPGTIERMQPNFSFAQSDIKDGDIICFQLDHPEDWTRDLERLGFYSNPVLYYDFLQNRVMIIFKTKYDEVDQDHPEFNLVLSKKQNYDIMAAKVGEYLRHDAVKLRFTTTHASNGTAKTILKRSLNQSIAEIINPSTTVILYEKLDVSIVEHETKCSLKVTWTGVHNKEEAIYPFLLPKTSMVHDLAEHLAKKVALTRGGTGKIRIFEISTDGKMQKEFTGSEMVGNIPDPLDLYAEEISREELEADDSDKVIGVFHFSKDPSRPHGVPFNFVVKQGEKFFDTKKRLQARLGLSDKEIIKYRFALIQVSTFKQPSYIEEDDIIHEHRFAPGDVLGLDYVDKSGKLKSVGEEAIVIRGWLFR